MLRFFRTIPRSGPQAGWFRPAFAVLLGLWVPSGIALLVIAQGDLVFSGSPKDGSAYTLFDHLSLVIGALSMSFIVSWMAIPFAILALRLALMTGWAGCLTAICAAVVMGVPFVHVVMMGDVTTEENAIFPHIIAAIAVLGGCVWAAYWALDALWPKKTASSHG